MTAQGLAGLEIERVSPDEGCASQLIRKGRLVASVKTGAVRLTVRGEDGAVITDVMTRDDFRTLVLRALKVINDG